MSTVKRSYVLLVLALALTAGMAAVMVVPHTDQALAFATVITHQNQAVGDCSGSGC